MEIKLIVDNAIDELKKRGLDDNAISKAIDYWSNIAGINIKEITEYSEFDIEIINKLLSTFPSVLSKSDEFKSEFIELPEFSIEEIKLEEPISEDVEKDLEKLISMLSGEASEEAEIKVDKELEKELQKLAFSLGETEEPPQETPKIQPSKVKGIRLAAVISNNKIDRLSISRESEFRPNIVGLLDNIVKIWNFIGLGLNDFSSFHLKLASLTLYAEKKDGKIYIVLVETETVGSAKFFIYGLSKS
jgi:hypothetical protein